MRGPKRGGGELIIDHRASPGLTVAQASAAGYDQKYCGEGKLYEVATLSCAHCRGVQIKNPLRTRERTHCRKCGGCYICDACAAASLAPEYSHMPFDKRVDIVVEQAVRGLLNLTGH